MVQKRLGQIQEKEKQGGSAAQNWHNFIENTGLEMVDISGGIAQVLPIKDATELVSGSLQR